MVNNLSLRGNQISLISLEDESCISSFNLINESKFIDKNIEVLISENKTQRNIGYIYCYNYRSFDGYLYIKININNNGNENKEMLIEACVLLFDYIFTMMPVRKIYYEVFEYEINYFKFIKNMGFKLEANLKEDKFFNGKYNDKYILSLYRENFYMRLKNE